MREESFDPDRSLGRCCRCISETGRHYEVLGISHRAFTDLETKGKWQTHVLFFFSFFARLAREDGV